MDEKIATLLTIPENKTCFDCNAPQPKWASVNNSVFICLNCAGLHRGLGVNFSFIRSLTMDNWDDNQIKMLSIGGNNKLKLLLQEFGIPLEIKIETKYRLKALEYYRKMLRAEAFDEPIPVKPDIVSAFEVVEEVIQVKEKINEGIVLNTPLISNTSKNKPELDNIDQFFGKIGQFFKNSANDIQKGFKDLKIKDKANDFEQKAIAFKNKAVYSIEEKTNVAVSSVSSFFKKTIKFFESKNGDKVDESSNVDNSSMPISDTNPSNNISKEENNTSTNDSKNINGPSDSNNEDPNCPPQI